MKVGYGLSSVILISAFLACAMGQLFARKHHPFLYWTVILTTSTAGTTNDRNGDIPGLTGVVTVFTAAMDLGWGAPSAAAGIATPVGEPGHSAIFGYAAGAMMVNKVAPARRSERQAE